MDERRAAAPVSHLASDNISLLRLRESYRKQLLDYLDMPERTGSKALVWDRGLSELFGHVVEFSTLKERGCEKVFRLEGSDLGVINQAHVICVCRPHLPVVQLIAEQTARLSSRLHLLFVPRLTETCRRRLQNLPLARRCSVYEFPLDFIPLDNDVLSMQLGADSFRQLYVDDDPSCLYYCARGLHRLQTLFGVIPHIYGIGRHAKKVADILQQMTDASLNGGDEMDDDDDEEALSDSAATVRAGPWARLPIPKGTTIEQLVLIDRSVDFLTLFCAPQTFEGLVDELYEINGAAIKLPPLPGAQPAGLSASSAAPPGPTVVSLHSGRPYYRQLRDLNFGAVAQFIQLNLADIKQRQELSKTNNVAAMRTFLEKEIRRLLEDKSALSQFLTLSEAVQAYVDSDEFRDALEIEQTCIFSEDVAQAQKDIETLIYRRWPLPDVLRLIVLMSWCSNGLKFKQLEQLRTLIVQTYGLGSLVALLQMETSGLIRVASTQKTMRVFQTMTKTLQLVRNAATGGANIDNTGDRDLTTVFSGYAPLSARIVQQLLRPGGWRSVHEALKMLVPADESLIFQETQPSKTVTQRTYAQTPPEPAPSMHSFGTQAGRSVTLVCYVGGITYPEISALRLLAQGEEGVDFIVATTAILNGRRLLADMTSSIAVA